MARPSVKAVRRSAVLEPDAAGIDIGSQEIYVAVPPDGINKQPACSQASPAISRRWLTGCTRAGSAP
jgi:hypothetical protein